MVAPVEQLRSTRREALAPGPSVLESTGLAGVSVMRGPGEALGRQE